MTETTPAKRYTPEEKREGLIALAVTGSATKAAELTSIPRKTIEAWRTSQADTYSQIVREHGAQIDAQVTAQVTAQVQGYGNLLAKAVDKLDEDFDRLDARDLPNAIKNLQAAQAQAIDKRQLLTGKATDRVEHLDARELIAEIKAAVGPYVNSTAEDITGENA